MHFRELLLRIYISWGQVVRIPLGDIDVAERLAALETLKVDVIRGGDAEHLRAAVSIVR